MFSSALAEEIYMTQWFRIIIIVKMLIDVIIDVLSLK